MEGSAPTPAEPATGGLGSPGPGTRGAGAGTRWSGRARAHLAAATSCKGSEGAAAAAEPGTARVPAHEGAGGNSRGNPCRRNPTRTPAARFEGLLPRSRPPSRRAPPGVPRPPRTRGDGWPAEKEPRTGAPAAPRCRHAAGAYPAPREPASPATRAVCARRSLPATARARRACPAASRERALPRAAGRGLRLLVLSTVGSVVDPTQFPQVN